MATAKAWFATPQEILTAIRELFDDADIDRQGTLTTSEVVGAVMHFYRKSEGADVSTYRVESEVAVACTKFDINKDGRIQFAEFIEMFANGAPFRREAQ